MLCQEAIHDTSGATGDSDVVLTVAVRLIGINQPYIDNWSWRQGDVAAIARNYFQGGFHFARPQIDWAGDQLGYVGMDFRFCVSGRDLL